MENVTEFQPTKTAKKNPANLTVARFKRIQGFKIVSRMDPTKYGRLGSSKWGDKLHKFLDDKRISREDVQLWMDTHSKVTDPKIQKPEQLTGSSPEQLRSERGRALWTYGNSGKRPLNVPSSTSSTDSRNSGYTVASANTFNSAKITNYGGLPNPNFLESAPAPAPALNSIFPKCRIPIRSAVAKSSQSDPQSQDPLPKKRKLVQKTEFSPDQFRREIWKAMTHGHLEVARINVPSSAPSTDNRNSGDTAVSANTFNSTKITSYGASASSNPNILKSASAPASASNSTVPEFGIPITSAAAKSTQSNLQTQNHSMPLKPLDIAQNPEVSPDEVTSEDFLIGFGALQTLGKLVKKYNKPLQSSIPQIHIMYRKLEEIQKKNVVPKIPEPYLPEVKEEEVEMEPECVEVDGGMDNDFLETMEDFQLVTDGMSTNENNLDTQIPDEIEALDLSMKSNRGIIGKDFMNSQEGGQIEEMDLEN